MRNTATYAKLGITRERLHEQIAEQLETLIRAEELRAGDRLPPDRQLAELMAVSRPTVREAIRLLQHRGLVEVKPGSGTYVCNQRDRLVEDTIERYCSMNNCSAGELGELRALLEPAAAELAARRASEEDRRRIRELLDAYVQAHDGRKIRLYAELDMQLHLAVAGAARNKLLAVIYGSIAKLIVKWTAESAESSPQASFIDLGYADHVRCFEAILAGDAEGARANAEAYMRASSK